MVADMGLEEIRGMLLMADMEPSRPIEMANVAFMLGSSKQGKARRASGASI